MHKDLTLCLLLQQEKKKSVWLEKYNGGKKIKIKTKQKTQQQQNIITTKKT